MYVVVARFVTKPGEESRVAELLAEMIPHARSEPACQAYFANQSQDDPATILMYEQYDDEAGFDAHRETEAFKRIVAGQIVPLLDVREREIFDLVEPAKQS